MTLSQIVFPVDVDWSRGHALVFSADIAARISEVQSQVAAGRYRIEPHHLIDGRFTVGAFLLTECNAGGFLAPAFQLLDSSRFDEIEVVPISEVLLLLSPPPPDLMP